MRRLIGSILVFCCLAVSGAASELAITNFAGNTITWDTQTGQYYSVEWSPSLVDTSTWHASWYNQTAKLATSDTMTVAVPLFYRINETDTPYSNSPVVQETLYRQLDVELTGETNWWNAIATLADYQQWHADALQRLQDNGTITNLPEFGQVQYVRLGEGPTILLSHGGLMGYDNAYMLTNLLEGGYSLLCPSRPGYPGTPLLPGTNDTFELMADMMAGLLDALQITNRVFILGTSAGGPPALQFTLRHPEKTAGLIMWDAVSMPYAPNLSDDNNFIAQYLMPATHQDPQSWNMLQGYARYPEEVCFQWLQLVVITNDAVRRTLTKQFMADPGSRARLTQFMNTVTPISQRYAGTINESALMYNLPDYPLANITNPVFISHSIYDGDVPIENGYHVLNQVSGPTTNLFFYGGGHMFFLGENWTNILHHTRQFMDAYRYRTEE